MVAYAKAVASGQLQQQLHDPLDDELGQLAQALLAMTQRTATSWQSWLKRHERWRLLRRNFSILRQGKRRTRTSKRRASQMGATVAELRQTFSESDEQGRAGDRFGATIGRESSTGGSSAVRKHRRNGAPARPKCWRLRRRFKGLLRRTDRINAIIEVVNDLADSRTCWRSMREKASKRLAPENMAEALPSSPAEVRSLAERSKIHREVRSILQDIRLAGRDSAQVIDEGSRQRRSGHKLSNAAGELDPATRRHHRVIIRCGHADRDADQATVRQHRSVWQATERARSDRPKPHAASADQSSVRET